MNIGSQQNNSFEMDDDFPLLELVFQYRSLRHVDPESEPHFSHSKAELWCYRKFQSFELVSRTMCQISIRILNLLVVHKSSVEGFHLGTLNAMMEAFPLEGFCFANHSSDILDRFDAEELLDLDEVVLCD